MSYVTGTQSELLYAWSGAGVSLTGTTTATTITPFGTTTPGPVVNQQFFQPPNALFKTIRFIARGQMTTAATAVTFTFRPFYCSTTDGTVTTALIPAAGAAGGWNTASPAVSQTGLPWEMVLDITWNAIGASGTAYVFGSANFSTTATANATTANTLGTNATIAIPTNATFFLALQCTLSATTASNSTTCNQAYVYGLN